MKPLTEEDKALITDVLKKLLGTHEEVLFALLYGSMADPVVPGKYGDIDVAVYLKPDQLDRAEYILEAHLEAEAFRLLSAQGVAAPPVEVTVINHAPYSFLLSLFRNPYIVLKANEEALSDLIDEVSGRALASSHLRRESLREVLEG